MNYLSPKPTGNPLSFGNDSIIDILRLQLATRSPNPTNYPSSMWNDSIINILR